MAILQTTHAENGKAKAIQRELVDFGRKEILLPFRFDNLEISKSYKNMHRHLAYHEFL
jgi:hypothetical protein